MEPITQKKKVLSEAQEAARRDVQRDFGVLRTRFHIISQPGRALSMDVMPDIVTRCSVLHNMGVEERENTECRYFPEQGQAVDFNMGENAVPM